MDRKLIFFPDVYKIFIRGTIQLDTGNVNLGSKLLVARMTHTV